jgi:hypothetical protein
MPAWCRRILSELDAADERAKALAGTLTPEQLNWKRQPGEWSIGQCLEHLCISSDVYLPPVSDSLAGQRAGKVEEITIGWFGRWFIRSNIEPSSPIKRRRAPKKIVPAARVEASILSRFLESNRALRELVRRAADYDVNRIRFRNPFIPVIRFTVGTGLEILPKHQRRHLMQAESVRNSKEFPGVRGNSLA